VIDAATLARIEVFRGLNAPARQALLHGGVRKRFGADEVLFTAGSASRGLFVILEGQVRVVRAASDRQHVVHTEGPGGTLGEVPLFEGGTYPATAIAARPTTCVVLTRDALRAAISADVSLAWAFLSQLSARVRLLVNRLDRLAAQSVQARLAGLILTRTGSANGAFTLGGTQVEIAEELGTVREVVVRALRELRQLGAIGSGGRGRLVVKDLTLLRQLAGEA
jgi:CRP/FNR family transcriptional regulator